MKLACPSCHQPIEVQAVDSELSAQESCGVCGAVVGVALTVTILSAGGGMAAPRVARVVVAMTDPELRGAYAEALAAAGFAVIETGESRQTLQRLGKEVPDVAVIDGSFSPIFGMNIAEIVKKSNVTRETRVLGLRADDDSPLPVPGADRTVSMTLGTDAIVREVEGLATARKSAMRPMVSAPAAPARPHRAPQAAPPPVPAHPSAAARPPAPAPAPVAPVAKPAPVPAMPPVARPAAVAPAPRPTAPPVPAAAPARPAATGSLPPTAASASPGAPADPEHAAAMRLARIIISDTALYNQPAVDAAIRSGRLKETIEGLLDEGRQHYTERTPDHIRAGTDYLGAALDQFVDRKMRAASPAAV